MAVSVLDSWSFVNDDDPQLQSTGALSSGSERCLVLAYGGFHDISAFGWTVVSVSYGNAAPTATFKSGDSTDDMGRYFALWNETALASATDQQFRWSATTIANEFFGWAVYEGVDQSNLTGIANFATNLSGDQNDVTLTTTSSIGDRIIVVGGCGNSDNFTITDPDTLTVIQSVGASSTNARYCLLEGNGGDSTTVIDHTNFRPSNFSTITLPQSSGGITPQAMYHYRNHGKI